MFAKQAIIKTGIVSGSRLRIAARFLLWASVLWFGLYWLETLFAYLFYCCLFFGLVLFVSDKIAQRGVIKKPSPTPTTELLGGRYEVERQLRAGGMAMITVARDQQTNTKCVIKTPKPAITQSDYNLNVEKLTIEAAYLRQFNHPNIVRFVDLFTHNEELHLVVEYIQGEDLLMAFASVPAEENRVIKWAGQILDALQYIHRAGLIHRDLNPGNIMLRSSDDIAIIDFGTLKPVAADAGTIVRKSGFDVPEQLSQGYSDKRSDLYGVASTLLYVLTCTPPGSLGRTDPTSFLESKGVSQGLARCIGQALQMDSKLRFADAAAMRMALFGRGK